MTKCTNSDQKWKNALFASKAENVALAQGILMVLGGKNTKKCTFRPKVEKSQNSDFLQKYQYFMEIHDFSEISHFCSFGCENHQYSIGFISFWRHAHFPYQNAFFVCEICKFTFSITRRIYIS